LTEKLAENGQSRCVGGKTEGCGWRAKKYLAHFCGQGFSLRRPGNPFSGPVVLRHRVAPVLLLSESAINFNDKYKLIGPQFKALFENVQPV